MLHYQTDPMMRDARALGLQLTKEHAAQNFERRYEVVCLVMAFSLCVNIGGVIYFLIQVAKLSGHS
jgi:hypothetical protein